MTQIKISANSNPKPKPKPKPKLRGLSHLIAALISMFSGIYLYAASSSAQAKLASILYSITLFSMFAISALYHCPTWSPKPRARLRRLDHAAIYLLIAGSGTPLCMLILQGPRRTLALALMWLSASAGLIQSTLWVGAPRLVSAGLYILMGWVLAAFVPELIGRMGISGILCIAFGGIIYSVGAFIYALRKPDPWPETFGYHEIFHALVIIASMLHYYAILQVVRTS